MHLADAIDADARTAERGGSSMRKPVLLVTAHFVDAVEARLQQGFELRRKKNGALCTPEELLSAADGADAMFVTPADRLDAAFFNRVASSVKVIATHSVGYDHIDLKAAAAEDRYSQCPRTIDRCGRRPHPAVVVRGIATSV
jgi:hypothetical protein